MSSTTASSSFAASFKIVCDDETSIVHVLTHILFRGIRGNTPLPKCLTLKHLVYGAQGLDLVLCDGSLRLC